METNKALEIIGLEKSNGGTLSVTFSDGTTREFTPGELHGFPSVSIPKGHESLDENELVYPADFEEGGA